MQRHVYKNHPETVHAQFNPEAAAATTTNVEQNAAENFVPDALDDADPLYPDDEELKPDPDRSFSQDEKFTAMQVIF